MQYKPLGSDRFTGSFIANAYGFVVAAVRGITSCVLGAGACHDDGDPPNKEVAAPASPKVSPVGIEQVAPPLALRAPPADAAKADGGASYKTLISNPAGTMPKRGDTVLLRYTGWIQRTGTTFLTTHAQDRPVAIDLAHAAPGLADTLPRLHKGETAMLWLPPSQGTPEAVVYEVELVDIVSPAALARQTRTATSR